MRHSDSSWVPPHETSFTFKGRNSILFAPTDECLCNGHGACPSQQGKGRSTRTAAVRGGHNQLSELEGFGTATSGQMGLHEKLGKALEVHELH